MLLQRTSVTYKIDYISYKFKSILACALSHKYHRLIIVLIIILSIPYTYLGNYVLNLFRDEYRFADVLRVYLLLLTTYYHQIVYDRSLIIWFCKNAHLVT